ncbi:hypothetical protein OS493_011869 [Desmophyllum pertusum]|uniref:Uncharacterized protein n=1 Tax=Desmophyllum pertusum TaxID=174260 RepID=A0A9W9YE10_9CNID|nr:hypothetical protein OS493_011869 [Desmophyllum pertusum]
MKAIFTVSFIACYIIALTTCVPVNRSSPSWPCQKDKDVRKFLSEALITSRDLAGQASVLSNIMAIKWPTDPYKEANVDLLVPPRRFNKAADMPEQMLRVNCRTLRAFISLMNNSTNQLKRFQDAEGLVTSKLVYLKNQTRFLISCLRKIVTIIKQRRGQRSSAPQAGQQRNKSRPVQTAAIQDVILQTKVILDEFNAHALNLVIDLWKVKGMTCN